MLQCSVSECKLSIFPASMHQFYANILVFVNINPFLYINVQFTLQIQKKKSWKHCMGISLRFHKIFDLTVTCRFVVPAFYFCMHFSWKKSNPTPSTVQLPICSSHYAQWKIYHSLNSLYLILVMYLLLFSSLCFHILATIDLRQILMPTLQLSSLESKRSRTCTIVTFPKVYQFFGRSLNLVFWDSYFRNWIEKEKNTKENLPFISFCDPDFMNIKTKFV